MQGDCLGATLRDGELVLIVALRQSCVEVGHLVAANVGSRSVIKWIVAIGSTHVELAGETPYLRLERARLSGRVVAAAPSNRPWRWRWMRKRESDPGPSG